MSQKALLSALLARLIGSRLLTGCATPFEKYYKSAGTAYGAPAVVLLKTEFTTTNQWGHSTGTGTVFAPSRANAKSS